MIEEPKLKKKGLLSFRGQYIYSGIIVFVLLFGLTYSLVFFIQNQFGTTGTLTSNLISVETSNDGEINLENLTPVADEIGLIGTSKVLKITNTSNTNISVKLGLTADNNGIPASSMRYGVYLNNTLNNVDDLSSEYLYEGILLKGETVNIEVYLWPNNAYKGDETTFSGTFKVDTSNMDMLGTEYVSRLTDKEKGLYAINNEGALYTDTGTIREYRYSGENPDNYVWFNCQDGTTSGSSNCELWRIVGSFNIKGNEYQNSYQRLKLVKEESLDSRTFGTSNNYSSSSLNTYLNETYYNSLTDSAKSMILDSIWNIGNTVLTNTPNASLESEKTSIYTGKIGLLSASDLGYSTSTDNYTKALNDSDLYNNSWLKEESYYAINAVTGSTTNIIGNDGTSFTNLEITAASGIKPSVYLSPTVSIKGGNGTQDKPYELALESENQYYAELPFKTNSLQYKVATTMPLTTSDVSGDKFVYGSDVDDNYVWYSGKMWRVVSINTDGRIKLVTQGNMTSLAWSVDGSTDYSTSQIRSWLNTEFLPTINESLIVDSTWDYTTYGSFPTEKDTENAISVSNKVGLLSVYDYMMTGGTDSSTTTKTFLNNGYQFWTSSPSGSSYVWYGNLGDYGHTGATSYGFGVRPSVNLNSDITLTGEGDGSIETPYMLEEDTEAGQVNEMLSNRISGEYIKFNNIKYRVVGIENGLTKITMADYDVNKNTLLTSIAFGASTSELTFGTTYGIGKYLNDWYNATSESDTSGTYTGLYLEKTYKDMIATSDDGIMWYIGPDDGTSYDYTKATEGTAIEAIIGLGRYGEMFSTQFGDGSSASTATWLMTKYSGSDILYVSSTGTTVNSGPTNTYGARPSFYLKSNVKIESGSGLPNDPYEIYSDANWCSAKGVNTLYDCILASESSNTNIDEAKTYIANKGTVDVNNVATTDEGLYKTEDDFGDSYFYRGDVKNNNVYFGGYYWKIVRTNGDNSIRLIYSGETIDASENNAFINNTTYSYSLSQSSIGGRHADPAYVGYMFGKNFEHQTSEETTNNDMSAATQYYFADGYEFDTTNEIFRLNKVSLDPIAKTLTDMNTVDETTEKKLYELYPYSCKTTSSTAACDVLMKIVSVNSSTSAQVEYISYSSTSLDGTRTNEVSSNVKNQLDAWYLTNIVNKKDGDGNLISDYIVDGTFCNDRSITDTTYNSGYLLDKSTYYAPYSRLHVNSKKTASLKCSDVRDRFSTTTTKGNAKLTYPVALISADEVALAGGKSGSSNDKYYLRTGAVYWTMSPSRFYSANAFANVWRVYPDGRLQPWDSVTGGSGIRAVINLSSDVLVDSGNGTAENPYILRLAD